MTYAVIALPIILLFQLYFWSEPFNHYTKSFLFSEKVFSCHPHTTSNSISLRLPERTVFQGKEDECSAFYTTYTSSNEIIRFYEKEFSQLKSDGTVGEFEPLESNIGNEKGFLVKVDLAGLFYEIRIREYAGVASRRTLQIEVYPND